MSLFADLERLISAQSASGQDAPSVLASIGTPTASVAVLVDGEISSHSFSTIGDDTETLFQACSISKPIAAMAAMRLVQQGKLRLDDKIVGLLPEEVINTMTDGAGPNEKALFQHITVKQLLSHTAGLSVPAFPGYPTTDASKVPDARQIIAGKAPANTGRIRMDGMPGQSFAYSGGGTTVMQVILETITGKSFPDLMRELVLGPLGMSRSFYSLSGSEVNVAKAHYTGYTPCEVPANVQPEQAAAGLWTTPTDLLRAVHAMQLSLNSSDDTEVQNTSEINFLSRELAREMLTEVQSGVAIGWWARAGGYAFHHSGSNEPGWRCCLVGYADLRPDPKESDSRVDIKVPKNCGICVMTNAADGISAVYKIMVAIMHLKGWPEIHDARLSVPFAAVEDNVDEGWRGWAGKWSDERECFHIEEGSDGKPQVRYGQLPAVRLLPAALSTESYGKGKRSVKLMLEGLQMMLHLGWDGDTRTAELWLGLNGKSTKLKKQD